MNACPDAPPPHLHLRLLWCHTRFDPCRPPAHPSLPPLACGVKKCPPAIDSPAADAGGETCKSSFFVFYSCSAAATPPSFWLVCFVCLLLLVALVTHQLIHQRSLHIFVLDQTVLDKLRQWRIVGLSQLLVSDWFTLKTSPELDSIPLLLSLDCKKKEIESKTLKGKKRKLFIFWFLFSIKSCFKYLMLIQSEQPLCSDW